MKKWTASRFNWERTPFGKPLSLDLDVWGWKVDNGDATTELLTRWGGFLYETKRSSLFDVLLYKTTKKLLLNNALSAVVHGADGGFLSSKSRGNLQCPQQSSSQPLDPTHLMMMQIVTDCLTFQLFSQHELPARFSHLLAQRYRNCKQGF